MCFQPCVNLLIVWNQCYMLHTLGCKISADKHARTHTHTHVFNIWERELKINTNRCSVLTGVASLWQFLVDYYQYNTSVFWRNAWRKVNLDNIFEFSLDPSFIFYNKNVNLFKSGQKETKILKITKPPWVWLAILCQRHHNTRHYLHVIWSMKQTMKSSIMDDSNYW
jgi:hypothetical protein